MLHRRTAWPLMALLLAATSSGQAPKSPLRGLDEYIEQARQDWGIAGLAVAVVKDDAVVYAKGFGVREAGKPDRVDERTLFAIGSNTKAFTAAAVGMLVDEGKLNLDDLVTKHLPYFQMYDPYVTREMTLRDLMTHRSGLARGDQLWYASGLSRREVIERVRYLEPSWGFRAQYGYQNIMFVTAGEVVAAVSGMSWDDFIKRRFFQPLAMTTSNTSTNDLRTVTNVAQPHYKVEGKAQPIPWRNIDNAGPAGSINSSVLEMTSWLRLLLNNGSHGGRRLISERYVREMTRPQMISGGGGPVADTSAGASFFNTYGLGLAVRDYYGKKLVTHGGGIDGMLSTFVFMPQERLGVVILTNTEGQSLGNPLANYILNAYLGVPQRDLSRIALERARQTDQRADSSRRALEARRVAGTRPSLALDRYVGRYDNRLYGEAQVSLDGGTLVLRRGPAYIGKLEHWHFDTFRADWGHPRMGRTFITFALDAEAKVAKLTIDGLGDYRRLPDRAATATSPR